MPKILLKTPITYYGGKQRLCAKILRLIPEHTLYCEPFLGGAAVFFAKKPSRVEILNDTNRVLMNFYEVVKHDYASLEKEIKSTLHSRDLYEKASIIYNHPGLFDKVKLAWAVWVLSCQSFGSKFDTSWSIGRKSEWTAKNTINRRNRFTDEYALRLENVQLECTDALYIISSRDSENSFFYCDPPYFNSDCGHYDGYSEADFIALLETLSSIKGKFLLSSYPSDVLKEYITKHGWRHQTIEQRSSVNNKTGKAGKKFEVLTSNYHSV